MICPCCFEDLGIMHRCKAPDKNPASLGRIYEEMKKLRDERDAALLQKDELLALLKKIDAFFEDPKVYITKDRILLDVPYEVASEVKSALTSTTLKRKDSPQKIDEDGKCGNPECECG